MSAQSFTPFEYLTLIFQGIHFAMGESVPEQITVTSKGVGNNQNEAVESALNSAVQKAVGVLVLSEQSAKNDRVIRNLVASYSSGVVNSHKIDSCQKDKFVTCTVTAKVSPVKFMRKLQGDSQTIQVNGNDLLMKHQTARNALLQREKITQYYFSQIRQSGLEVQINSVSVIPTTNNKALLQIEYEVKWNKEFKKEIIRFLEKLEKDGDEKTADGMVYIQWGPTGLFENRVYIYTHNQRFRSMMNEFIFQPTHIRINELGICDNIEHRNVFTIDWYKVKREITIEVPAQKLSGLQSLSASLGCAS